MQKKHDVEAEKAKDVKSSESPANTPDNRQSTTQTTTHSTPMTPQSGDKNEKLGIFQHIPHLMKLYEVLKGAFKNHQVSPVSHSMDKFCLFVRGVLESLSLLLELATFNELGSHAEEFLEYLKATVHVDEEGSFLAVQQVTVIVYNHGIL